MKFIIAIGGVTNGGKTTLTNHLMKVLSNCCVVHQDDFFKPQDQIAIGADGFKQYDTLEALDMDAMVATVRAWVENPHKFALSHGVEATGTEIEDKDTDSRLHILIVEGFLLYTYPPLMDLLDQKFFISIPYQECKLRRSTRNYTVPDPPGLFDAHVWPMYLKNRAQMNALDANIVHLDGKSSRESLFTEVFNAVQERLNALL